MSTVTPHRSRSPPGQRCRDRGDQRDQELPEVLPRDRSTPWWAHPAAALGGRATSADASPSFCRMPRRGARPPILEGRQPNEIKDLHAARQPFAGTHAPDLRKEADVLETVSSSYSEKRWTNTRAANVPTRFSFSGSYPPIAHEPESALRAPTSIRIVVVLPAPSDPPSRRSRRHQF